MIYENGTFCRKSLEDTIDDVIDAQFPKYKWKTYQIIQWKHSNVFFFNVVANIGI